MSAGKLAKTTLIPQTRIEQLVREEVDLTPDTALRLARYFGTTPAFWMNLQTRYALDKAQDRLDDGLDRIRPIVAPH